MKTLTLHIPDYRYNQAPRSADVGRQLDELLHKEFPGKTIVVRGIDLRSHKQSSLESLVESIQRLGIDKDDKDQVGIADHIVPKEFRDRFIYGDEIILGKFYDGGTERLIHSLYHGALGDRGYSVRADIVLVYDRSAFTRLQNIYEGASDSDIFVFEQPPKKLYWALLR